MSSTNKILPTNEGITKGLGAILPRLRIDSHSPSYSWQTIVTQNLEPLPRVDSNSTAPPINSTILLVINNPNPLPPKFRVILESAWRKYSNINVCLSLAIPSPVSITSNCKVLVLSKNFTCKLILPVLVNLIALLNKLCITCLIRVGSATIHSGITESNTRLKSSCFFLQLKR